MSDMTDARRKAIVDRIRWINTHTRQLASTSTPGKAKPR